MSHQTEQNKEQGQSGQQSQQNRRGQRGRRIQKLVLSLAVAATLAGLAGCACPTSDRTAGRVIDDRKVTGKVKHALANEPVYKYEDVTVTTHNGIVQLSGWATTDDQRAQAGQIASRTEGVYDVINNISIKRVPAGREDGFPYRPEANTGAYRSERDNGAYRTGTNQDVDNSRRNVRDRDDATLTPGDQGNTPADREITRKIRKALVIDASGYSMTAKNIKIITLNGKVALRGPVKTEAEKSGIVTIAKNVAGDANVDDQLEVKATP